MLMSEKPRINLSRFENRPQLRLQILTTTTQNRIRLMMGEAALMAQYGFQRTVTGVNSQGNSVTLDLPLATYYGSSNSDCSSLRDTIAAIRAEIQQGIVMFVVQAQTWATA
jgi:hypothetical protein